jgi:hypothetical protein
MFVGRRLICSSNPAKNGALPIGLTTAFNYKKLSSISAVVNMNYIRVLPWIFLSGVAFVVLSYAANRYHGKERSVMELAQDFIGGSVFIGLLSAIVPDIFPDITTTLPMKSLDLSGTISSVASAAAAAASFTTGAKSATGVSSGGSLDDIELQVGPIP